MQFAYRRFIFEAYRFKRGIEIYEAHMTIARRQMLTFPAAMLSLGASSQVFSQASPQTLVALFQRAVRTLDGNYANLRENDILGLMVDDALFAVDPVSGKPFPLAAREATFSAGNTIIVKLRNDVMFHDGSKMTADDVAYTYRYLINPKSRNEYYDRFSRWLSAVDVVSPDTVVFRMKDAYAMALYDLAMYSKIRKKGTYDDASKPDGLNPEAQTLQLNGTGPYRVRSFRPGQEIVLERVEGYRTGGPKGSPAIKNMTIRIIPDWSTQAAEVMSGGAHWTFGVPMEIAEGAAATKRAQLLSGPSMRVFYLSIDATGKTAKAEPLTNVLVRRAINHAINNEGIVRSLVRGTSKAIHTACDPVQFGCDLTGVTKYAYDTQKARALLAQAGYPNGFDIEFWAARDRPVAEVIVSQLRNAGIRAQLRYVLGPTLSQARREGKIALELASSGSFGIPDAGALLPDRLGPNSDRNFSGDEALSKTILDAVSTTNPGERRKHFSTALKRIADQAYWVPLYVDSQNFLMANNLNFAQPGDGMPRLYSATWK
jgi:peptide/nickel transport system substrate-binding protein